MFIYFWFPVENREEPIKSVLSVRPSVCHGLSQKPLRVFFRNPSFICIKVFNAILQIKLALIITEHVNLLLSIYKKRSKEAVFITKSLVQVKILAGENV